jgi:putative transposase
LVHFRVPGGLATPHEDADRLRLRLIDQILHLPVARLAEVEDVLRRLPQVDSSLESRPEDALVHPDWPHAPVHRLSEEGTFIVTAATYHKEHFFRGPDRLQHLHDALLAQAKAMHWQLEAWAVFSNHYHFVAHALPGAEPLSVFTQYLHGATSAHVNLLDRCQKRKVWFNYWETALTFEASYLARLSYVHQNQVKHGLVKVARQYPWCSAGWFERTATRAQVQVLSRFKIDKVNIQDDFDPV